ncbi:hypothetical protein M8C21_032906, partial [Ambrosia artemisiifolia]
SLIFELTKPNQTLTITKSLHALLTKTSLIHDPFYTTKLTKLYSTNDNLTSARNLFDEMPNRTVYLWNSIIRAYAQTHCFHEAFTLFKHMPSSPTKPDSFTFACIARACAERHDVKGVMFVHGQVVVFGYGMDAICGSALVSGYSKVGLVDHARMVFDGLKRRDLVLYNAMISGYGSCGDWEKGLCLFVEMRKLGNRPDGYTVVGLLSGFTRSNLLDIGRGVHGYCLRDGFGSNAHKMNFEGRKSDSVLVATLLAASAQMAILAPGVEMHGYAIRHNLDSDIMVSSALIDMYSKCGFLEMGVKVFGHMPKRNMVSYNSVIASLGLYGLASEAFKVFREAVERGLKPDESTFCALLSACSHGGFVKEGRDIFRRMDVEFGVKAKTEHYVHFVKLLGMAGELDEAYNLICSLGNDVDSGIWGALLSCCDVHNDSKLAEIVARRVFDKQRDRSAYKVMVSNFHAGNGRWDVVKNLRDDLDDVGMKKNLLQSLLNQHGIDMLS